MQKIAKKRKSEENWPINCVFANEPLHLLRIVSEQKEGSVAAPESVLNEGEGSFSIFSYFSMVLNKECSVGAPKSVLNKG